MHDLKSGLNKPYYYNRIYYSSLLSQQSLDHSITTQNLSGLLPTIHILSQQSNGTEPFRQIILNLNAWTIPLLELNLFEN
jgi:hypothetical protein